MKAMAIDIVGCNGCYNCRIPHKDEHIGNDWSSICTLFTGHENSS